MKIKWLPLLLAAALALSATAAIADWTEADANLAYYERLYGEASEAYKTLKYGNESDAIGQIKETLSLLGYFPGRMSNTYYRSLETAVRVLATQLRIGGDGREITPLLQAIIADTANLPRALVQAIDVTAYSWEESKSAYTAYTFARLSRSGVRTDTNVGFAGEILLSVFDAKGYHYAVQMEDDPEKIVYVTYNPPARTTVFQPGDRVSVFGVTKGEQSLTHDGMEKPALLVSADRIGYAVE